MQDKLKDSRGIPREGGGKYFTGNRWEGAPKILLPSTGSGIFVENVCPISEFLFILERFETLSAKNFVTLAT